MNEEEMDKYKKAYHEACEMLTEMTGNGDLLCPAEYLGICSCVFNENGFECPDDSLTWEQALLIKNTKD